MHKISLILIVISFYTVKAQDPTYLNYNSTNGLSSNRVFHILKDRDGFMWFATDAGVCKFDGVNFTKFNSGNGLPDNVVHRLFEDSYGRIWLENSNGKPAFILNDSIFSGQNLPVLRVNDNLQQISSIVEDEKQNIWLSFLSGYILKLDRQLTSFSDFAAEPRVHYSFIYEKEIHLIKDYGIFCLKDKKLNRESEFNRIVDKSTVRAYRNKTGMFISTAKELYRFSINPNDTGFSVYATTSSRINFIGEIKGQLCTGNQDGLTIINNKGKTETYFKGKAVSSVCEDNEGGYWISTLDNGVLFIPDFNIRHYNMASGLISENVTRINGIDNNHIIAGHKKSKITIMTNHKFETLDLYDENPGGEGLNYGIKRYFNSDTFFVFVESKYLKFSFSTPSKFITQQGLINSVEFINRNKAVVSTSNKLIYLNEGLSQINDILAYPKLNIPVFANVKANDLIYLAADSLLLAGTNSGLVLIKNNKYYSDPAFNFLSKKDIYSMKSAGNNLLVISTYGHGIFVKINNKNFEINKSTGLSDDLCKGIYIDSKKNIWVTTRNGLNKISFSDTLLGIFSIKKYYSNQGLACNDLNDVFVFKDTVWVASSLGITMFTEPQTITPLPEHKIFITHINDKPYSIAGSKYSSSEFPLKISFLCPSYKFIGNLLYKYRFPSISEIWNVTSATTIETGSIPPGNQSFEVMAFSSDGSWETKPEVFTFSIVPQFWQTLWFSVLVVFIIASTVSIIIFRRVRNLTTSFATREKILHYERGMLELEQQALRLQMNPHFIFNAMNSIQFLIIKKRSDEAYTALEKFSSLIRKIMENSKHKLISLEEEIEALQLYLEIEARRFSDSFIYKVEVDETIITESVMLPPMILQPYVENALWHGLMAKDGEKRLNIKFTNHTDKIECVIEDNGIGRIESKKLNIGKTKSSLSMKLTADRIMNMNTHNEKIYELKIEDLNNDKNESLGTKIILCLYKNNEYENNNC